VTDETLAVDVTREVGISGSFLDTDHTMKHFRSEFFEPSILFRQRRPDWVAAGKKTLSDAAEDCADALIAQEREPYLSPEQDAELAKIETDFLERMR
jgi:trimethylamine--corrinoid protein Co-methyltransferase